MSQIYKVFINNCELIITDNSSEKGVEYTGKEQLNTLIGRLENQEEQQIIVWGKDPELIWNDFNAMFKIIEAAGGVVYNTNGKLLMIHRLGKWDLPKGKIERGEVPSAAAKREVQEECGLSELEIGRELQLTYHTYQLKGEAILKKTYWFLMGYVGNEELVPQTEEDISEACWCSKTKVEQNLKNTYGNIEVLLANQKY